MKFCNCGSGLHREQVLDGYGIFLTYVCDKCREHKLKEFRPDILDRYPLGDEVLDDE